MRLPACLRLSWLLPAALAAGSAAQAQSPASPPAPASTPAPASAPSAAAPAALNAGDDADRRTAEAMITRGREAFGPPQRSRCGIPAANGEITVCATSNAQFRTQSSNDADPTSRAATRTGMPAPPELGRGSCRGKPGCLIGGRAPPPIYIFDLKTIPETPKGSDADKVANGELSDR